MSDIIRFSKAYLLECGFLFCRYSYLNQAQKIFQEILKEDLKTPQAIWGLGECLYRQTNWTAAARCFLAHHRLTEEASSLLWAAASLKRAGQAEEAEFYRRQFEGKTGIDFVEAQLSLPVPDDFLNLFAPLNQRQTQSV